MIISAIFNKEYFTYHSVAYYGSAYSGLAEKKIC